MQNSGRVLDKKSLIQEKSGFAQTNNAFAVLIIFYFIG
jgi:hypothetical protein